MMERIIAYACLGVSGAFAGYYGYSTGDSLPACCLRALAWGLAAIVGGCTPAWVLHHWDSGKIGRAGLTLVLGLLCWAMTIYGSVGGFASSADRRIAERTRQVDAASSAKQQLAMLSAERAKLEARPIGTVEADMATVKEQTKKWWKLDGELATAKQAKTLDEKIAALSGRLYTGDAPVTADPGATALALISGKTPQEIAAWSMLLGAVSLELAGMIAMMRADALPRPCAVAQVVDLQPPPHRLEVKLPQGRGARIAGDANRVPAVKRMPVGATLPRASPSVTAGTPRQPPKTNGIGHVYGSVRKFKEQCLVEEMGERLELKAVLARYNNWCERHSVPPASFAKFCDDAENLLTIDVENSTVYALDVRFA